LRLFLIGLLVLVLAACSIAAPAPAPPTAPLPTSAVTTIPPTAAPTLSPEPTLTSAPPSAASFPDTAAYTWKQVAAGLERPVEVQDPGDGSGRLFIVEQAGRILILQNGALLPTPFLDIRDKVTRAGNEQGLLGLVFHPAYAQNGRFFVHYSDNNGDTMVARLQVSADPNIADAASETPVLTADQPYPNHNGGTLAFGPEGYLYIGLGDGGSGGDPLGNGQRTDTVLGKILRLDVDSGGAYSIPSDNPFGNEIWAYGLRNPWRFSFDQLTYDLYIGDVGQGAREEIDFLPAGSPGGANFGWNIMEADEPYSGGSAEGLIPPVASYGHGVSPGGCSVTGGYVYRGGALPEWQGIYLYGDYCTGIIWGLLRTGGAWQNQILFQTGFNISSFGQDASGELYLTDLGGAVYRLERK